RRRAGGLQHRAAPLRLAGQSPRAGPERHRVPVGAVSDASPWAFSHSDEVRFADLDVMGHLNNVAFLVFAESARGGYMQELMPNRDLVAGDFGVMIAETKISYRAPGHFGERIETRLRPADLGRTSFRVDFEMRVGDRVIADGYTVMVLYDRSAARPMVLPDA